MRIFLYILYIEDSIYSLKIRHMKHSMHLHLGQTAVTVLLAVSFLGLVMFLSYIFISSVG
jgi:hypothetical protein